MELAADERTGKSAQMDAASNCLMRGARPSEAPHRGSECLSRRGVLGDSAPAEFDLRRGQVATLHLSTEAWAVEMAETETSFWRTAPGMITAVAALITAVGGVLGILLQSGVLGADSDARASDPDQAVSGDSSSVSSDGTGTDATTGSTSDPSLIPWDEATATFVRQDGTQTTVKAATVYLACEQGVIEFKNGQRVDLKLVRDIGYDSIYLDNASADGVVTLLDGRRLTYSIHTWNCPVVGSNDLGTVEIELDDIKRIQFNR